MGKSRIVAPRRFSRHFLQPPHFSRIAWRLLCFWLCGWIVSGTVRAQVQDVSVADVMVLYTPEVQAAAGGETGMSNLIRAAFAEGNLVFGNSQAALRVRCVYQGEISYEESGSARTDVNRLRDPADGFLDEVPALRDQHAADLVCLIVDYATDYDFYGLQGPSAENSFSVIRRDVLTGLDDFPVALSFNFGCQLERRYADSAGAFSFSYGYTFDAGGRRLSTVEAFSGSSRLPLFSNPDIRISGEPAGVPEESPVPCDNAKTLRLTAPLVGAFRGESLQVIPPTVAVLNPTNGMQFVSGDSAILQTTTAVGSSPISRVEFLDGSAFLGASTAAPYSLGLTFMNPGTHTITAVAYDSQNVSSVSQPVTIIVRPANDPFANATEIFGEDVTVTGSCRSATMEPGEPEVISDNVYARDKTVWWKWTAPTNTRVSVSVSDSPSFHVNLAVYTGTAVSNLTQVATGRQSVEFNVQAGVTYRISVGADAYTEGDFSLRLQASGVELLSPPDGAVFSAGTNLLLQAATIGDASVQGIQLARARDGSIFAEGTSNELSFLWTNVPPGRYDLYAFAVDESGNRVPSRPASIRVQPPNDDFANRILLTSQSNNLAATTAGAGLEPGEAGCGGTNDGTVWWSFPSPGKGRLHIGGLQVNWNGHSPALGVYTGEALSTLTECPYVETYTSWRDIRTLPGVSYAIRLCGDAIPFTLSWSWVPAPSNDDFANALSISGETVTNTADFAGATIEPDESSDGIDSPVASLWYLWNAPVSGRVVLSSPAQSAGVAVYTGTALTNLTTVLSNRKIAGSFFVQAGEDYLIKINSQSSGNYSVDWMLHTEPGPANDNFAARTLISNFTYSITATNVFATREPGEPDHSGNPGGASLWWSWTAPADGILTLTVSNQDSMLPVVAVYTGNSFSNLVAVATNLVKDSTSERSVNPLILPVQEGVSYQIAMDSYSTIPYQSNSAELLTGNYLLDLQFITFHLTEPPDGVHFTWPAQVECGIGPVYAPADGTINKVCYYNGTNELGEADPTSMFTLANLAPGSYSIVAVATNDTGRVLRSVPHQFSLAAANDFFADRQVLPTTNAPIIGDNSGATSEIGESSWSADQAGKTLWYTWTAPEDGTVTISPLVTNFIPSLGVFVGDSVTNLLLVASNAIHYCCDFYGCHDYPFLPFTFNVEAGTSYQLCVDGYPMRSLTPTIIAGGYSLAWSFERKPSNDSFADRVKLAGVNILFTNSNAGASAEPGEPHHDWTTNAIHSIWYSWTASAKEMVELDSDTDPAILSATASDISKRSIIVGRIGGCTPPTPPAPARRFAVYTGTSVSNIALVTAGSSVSFFAEPGNSYAIACDGVAGSVVESPFHLKVIPQPANDNFEQSAPLNGVTDTAPGTLFGATRQNEEPDHNSLVSPSTIWWSWTAPYNGIYRIWTHSPGHLEGNFSSDTIFIYTGEELRNLLPVAWNEDTQTFYARAGTQYKIAVVGYGDYPEYFEISISPASDPPFISCDNSVRLTDGSFAIGVSCPTGQSFVLQASTNLFDWQNIATNTALDTLTRLTDYDAVQSSQRFYRVISLESVLGPAAAP